MATWLCSIRRSRCEHPLADTLCCVHVPAGVQLAACAERETVLTAGVGGRASANGAFSVGKAFVRITPALGPADHCWIFRLCAFLETMADERRPLILASFPSGVGRPAGRSTLIGSE